MQEAKLNIRILQQNTGIRQKRKESFAFDFCFSPSRLCRRHNSSCLAFTLSKYYGFVALILTLVIFIYLLMLYSRHLAKQQYLLNLELINQNEIKAGEGDFSIFPDGSSFIAKGHDFSYDTDIFGPGSLFQFLNRTCTGYGSEVLACWLSDPYELRTVLRERQQTVAEIGLKIIWRQSFLATGINRNLDRNNILGMTKWLAAGQKNKSSAVRRLCLLAFPSLACITLLRQLWV